ncbi:MAG: glycosyltransferase [Betaproteobacteria bacterium]|jgi:glycosyltransferase involved in cell wall biosynthesis|nr:glycosyltransferase [Betaproteobacteria bacterium]
MQTKLSIIICAHNEESFIAECIESLHLTDHPQWEVIVINDASTDTTLDIVESFAQKHTNLRCHSLTHNVRPGNARNFAIMLARGEHITFLDADDYIDAAVLAEKVKMIDAGTDVFTSGHTRLFNHGLSTIAIEPGEFSGDTAACLFLMRKFRTWGSCIHIYRRSHVLQNNCLFASGVYYGDVVFCFNALYTARKVIVDPAPYYVYRCNNDSVTRFSVATPLHLMSSARLHFDLVQIIQTKPESDKLCAAFAKACNILAKEHLQDMAEPLQQGMHETSLEFFRTFIHYIKCCDTPFSRGVLAAIQSQPDKKFLCSDDMSIWFSLSRRIRIIRFRIIFWLSRVLLKIKSQVLNRPGKDRSK